MKTLKQIEQQLQFFADNHLILQDYQMGTEIQLNSFVQNNDKLPLLYSSVQDITMNGNTVTYFLKISVLDSRSKHVEHLTDIHSDTAQILMDLRQWLIYNYQSQNTFTYSTETTRITPLVNHTNDWLSGWTGVFAISAIMVESDCLIPLANI